MIVTVDHVQITVSSNDVEPARTFYCGLLGLREIDKPDDLKERGGFWLAVGDRQVHVGVEEGVNRQATKAHIAYRVVDLDGWRDRLAAAGFSVSAGVPIPGYDRLEFRDPFGNRLELIQAVPLDSSPEHRNSPMARPGPTEHAPYYSQYIALVPEEDIIAAMRSELDRTVTLLSGVAASDASVCHAPYTWTINQVVGHLIDTERIFGYRALRFARGDATPLPGFDETSYAQSAASDQRPLDDLAAEFEAVRNSHLHLFGGLPANAWKERGTANGVEISVLALAFIIVGHERHHAAIVRQRLSLTR
jgi:catechol 2,3-dioxygenase-like lactoylglutathione lyase family enzyme